LTWACGIAIGGGGKKPSGFLSFSFLACCSGWILADIWTLIGLICLFAISAGYAFPAIALLLSLSCSTHFGNFPTVSAAALMVLPLVRDKAKFAAVQRTVAKDHCLQHLHVSGILF
jgi:hypothetical protein